MTIRDSYYPLILTLLVLDGIAVALRFWVRSSKNAAGYDDLAMAVSFVGFVVFCAMELAAISYGIGATNMESGFDMTKAAMYFTVAQVVYILATGISKLGIALVLLRLADGSDMRILRIILVTSMATASVWSLVSASIFGLQCRPLSVAWGIGQGTCLSTTVLGNTAMALSAMDVTVSWLYALLPVWLLHKAHLPMKLKITVLILLGMGAVSSLATIIRLKMVVQITQLSASAGLANPEIIQKTLEATVYSILEIGLSIFAAALTALRPLLRHLPCFTNISSGGKSNSLRLHSIKTFGQRSTTDKGRAYRLEDPDGPTADSQENIVSGRVAEIHKRTDIELNYESSPSELKQSREHW